MRLRIFADPLLLLSYILGSCLSLAMLISISPDRFLQQAIVLVVGLFLLFYLSKQEESVYKSFALIGYLGSLIILLITILFASTTRGTLSWIDVAGFRFQPSELTKPFLILSFASLLERFPPKTLINIIINCLSFIIPAALIMLQPDLGTTLVITAIWLAQIFIAGIPWHYLLLGSLLVLISLPHVYSNLHDYQVGRLTTFLDPFADPLGSGYNVIQSMIAVGSGGILGKGLGQGTQSHLRFLPERHTDFAFASIAEELGLLGSLAILGVMATFIFRLLHFMTQAESGHSRTILSGSLAYFIFQSLVNIGMNIGVAPVTGITLPLISYGGSSILATAMILGLSSSVINGAKHRRLLEIR
ncbi:MAG: rod shape-determining protein RodA [bacterium]|nr:rod shape-determining protein RodA [Candidatus Microgenomates bacterium CPR3]MCQ3944601.1 rod shape-determining protein RodA [bacterium]RIK51585.1 MAG: rod shape-determining protein RodA [Candidatus Microgenomates bacterium]